MNVTVFNGSPQADHGNTHVMVKAFLQGARDAGAAVENVFLADYEIKPCRGCFTCWVGSPGVCVQDDDMRELLPKVAAADMLVFATPLYVDNVSGIMKTFMDRLIPLVDPHFEQDERGEYRHVRKQQLAPSIAAIANCGFAEQSHFQVLRLLFQRVARNLHGELIAEVYRGGGGLLQSTDPAVQAAVDGYLQVVRQAGREAVSLHALAPETAARLEQPLLPIPNFADVYMQGANEMWDHALAEQSAAR